MVAILTFGCAVLRHAGVWPNWGCSTVFRPVLITRPWVEEAGVAVLDKPFFAKGNVATAGGCLASQYLASWIIARLEGIEAARSAMHYVAPVGEKEQYVSRAMQNITSFLDDKFAAA